MSEDTARREAMQLEAERYSKRFEESFKEREMRRAADRKVFLEVILPGIIRRAARERMLADIR